MHTLHITLENKGNTTYPIIIGQNLTEKISSFFDLHKYSGVFIIADTNTDSIFSSKLQRTLPINSTIIVVAPGEVAKNLESVMLIWTELLEAKADRKSLIINLGGGVIGDMGGFAASTFMRGIDFIQFPTTLLAQVDASVGGKVGIDFLGVKNLIGSFNQPIGVIIDINSLKTLPKREFVAGFGEIIKHGLIYDKDYFDKVTAKKPKDFSPEELEEIIKRSCEIKSEVVSQDSNEMGVRKLLNFGHTVGHAIESLSLETESPLLHGEAVAMGMLVEAKISQLKSLIDEETFDLVKKSLQNADLITPLPRLSIEEIITKTKSDKKSEKGAIKWTLLNKIGKAQIDQSVDEKVVETALKECL